MASFANCSACDAHAPGGLHVLAVYNYASSVQLMLCERDLRYRAAARGRLGYCRQTMTGTAGAWCMAHDDCCDALPLL